MYRRKGTTTGRVKDNQEGLREEIEVLFQPHRKRVGTSAPPNDFRTARTVEKGHGREELRTITVSGMLADYSTWPALAQVFKLESQRTDALGTTKTQVRYGVTSLPASLADPQRLLQLTREHWRIECAIEARLCLLRECNTTGVKVVKATPYLMGKLKGESSMVIVRPSGIST